MRGVIHHLPLLTLGLVSTIGNNEQFQAHSFSPVPIRGSPSFSLQSTTTTASDIDTTDTTTSSGTTNSSSKDANTDKETKTNRVSILLCPAQFCVPADYTSLFSNIQQYFTEQNTNNKNDSTTTTTKTTIGTCRVAPLPRTEWIKVAKQLPTKSFLDADLDCSITLDWYFRAIESALADILSQEGENAKICIIGHSIGGWVARAYLGGLGDTSSTAISRKVKDDNLITSFVTLGTPHSSPSSALLDQTRGLLRQVEETSTCSPAHLVDERNIEVTCVGSGCIRGEVISSEVEELIAGASYLPLVGSPLSVLDPRVNVEGDGIVPLELAFMDGPARRVVVEKCEVTGEDVRHAHVLPTPWNLWDGEAGSIVLPEEFRWYGSRGVMEQWVENIR